MVDEPRQGGKQDRQRLRAQLRTLGFTDEDKIAARVAAELVRLCGKRPREAWRLARELSLDEVAARYNALLDDPRAPMRKSRISDFERWPQRGVRPVLKTLKLLAQIYGVSWDQLVDFDDLARLPAADLRAYHDQTQTPILVPEPPRALVVVPAHPLLRATPRDLEREMVMAAARESGEHAAATEAATVGQSAMEQLENEVVRLARDYLGRPPVKVFGEAVAARNQVYARLKQTRKPAQITELQLLAGVLCGLLSELSLDLGHPDAAAMNAMSAWAYGNSIGHDSLKAWARGMQSTIAFWSDRPTEALTAAQQGQEYAVTGLPAVRLHSIRARAWSHLGDIDETWAAIRAAEAARADATDHDALNEDVGGVFAWGPERQELSAGNALLKLGQAHPDPRIFAQAARHSRRALELFQSAPRSSTIETSTHVDLAAALLMAEELDGARQALEPIFALPGDRRTGRVLARLEQVRAQLGNPRFVGSPQTRELVADLKEFGNVSALQALPPER